MKKRVNDTYWLRNRTKYTCPFLMALSVWYYRLEGHRCFWCQYTNSEHGAFVVIRLGG